MPFSVGAETGGSLVYPASKAGLYAMRYTLGSVSAKACFRISRSFDGIGAMAKTKDLAPLIEAILTPESKLKIPEGGFESVMQRSWEGMWIGFVESTCGVAGEEDNPGKQKWGSDPVVSLLCSPNGVMQRLVKQKSKYGSAVRTIREMGGMFNIQPLHQTRIPSSTTI